MDKITTEALRDAITAVHLRTSHGVSVSEIATQIGATESRVRAAIKRTADRWGNPDIPDMQIVRGQSQGHARGRTPDTWRPTRDFLLGMIRGPGDHRWLVRGYLIAKGALGRGRSANEHVIASDGGEAIRIVKERTNAHPNSHLRAEWLGRED